MNTIIQFFGGDKIMWYSQPKWWPLILTFMQVWKSMGYNMVVYLASITGIDSTLYEAATLDGATKWQQTKYVTLPALKPIIVMMFILNVGHIFYSDFGLFYQVTQGVPNSLYNVASTFDTYVYQALQSNVTIGRTAAAGLFQAACCCATVLVANFIVSKIDEESREPIKNVTFAVSKMNGERIGTYRTDSDGKIALSNLESGWYTVIETKAAKGYALDKEPKHIEVKNGKQVLLTVTNRQTSSMLIHKIDSVTGEGIYGVTFLVSDARHNPIGQYTSDQSGYVYIDRELKDGKYYVQEIQPAEGYLIDHTKKTFYVEYGETSHITWKNTPQMGQIQITKKSADDNPING